MEKNIEQKREKGEIDVGRYGGRNIERERDGGREKRRDRYRERWRERYRVRERWRERYRARETGMNDGNFRLTKVNIYKQNKQIVIEAK